MNEVVEKLEQNIGVGCWDCMRSRGERVPGENMVN